MKRGGAILGAILALLLLLSGVSGVMAADEGSGTLVVSGTVENVAPVIEQDSLVVQIIDNEGVAWGWSAGGNSTGDRTMPYILGGEQLHFTLDVTDANGEADLAAMQVRVNLSANISFTGSLVSTAIDPDNGISRGRYSGNLTVDEGIAPGKYDITIDATDPAGATDTYDPAIYEPNADILKPALSLEVGVPTVLFPQSNPGDLGIAANDNPVRLTPQAVIGNEHIPVVFSISHSGTDMVDGSNVIPVSSIVWSTTNQITDNSLTSASQIIASAVQEGETVEVYYWLNVPSPQAAGDYAGSIDFQFLAD